MPGSVSNFNKKIFLDIEMMYDGTRDCFEELLVSIARWWGRDYEMSFAEVWGFTFTQERSSNTSIGDRITTGEINFLANFKKYHGIDMQQFQDNISAANSLDVIKQELFYRRPVILLIDLYWNPCAVEYQRHRGIAHFVLVVGIDAEAKTLFINDGTLMKNNVNLPIDHFLEGAKSIWTCRSEKVLKQDINWRQLLLNSIERPECSHGFDAMRQFSQELVENLDFALETKGYENKKGYGSTFHAPLFSIMRKIGLRRLHFQRFLNYIINNHKAICLKRIPEIFLKLSSHWSMIRLILMKNFIKKDSTNKKKIQKAATLINAVAEQEEKTAGIIKEIIKHSSDKKMFTVENITPKVNNQKSLTEFVFLDISKYFNNIGFGNSLDVHCTANLSEAGHYLVADDLPDNKVWIIEDMQFNFPRVHPGKADNILCQEQVINIVPGLYQSIMLLGCGIQGIYYENLGIEYIDGNIEYIKIGFSAPFGGETLFGEKVAWLSRVAFCNDNKVEIEPKKKPILAKSYSLKCKKKIKSIILPNCPAIHIFSITMCKT